MFQVICLFFPSFLSIAFYNFLNNSYNSSLSTANWINFLITYGSFCTINNLISIIFCSLLLRIQGVRIQTTISGNLSDSYLSIKFLLLATFVSIITAIIAEVIHKYVKLKITIDSLE